MSDCAHHAHFHPVHQHTDDIDERIADISNMCAEQGLRFTSLRKQVLRLVMLAERPIGAYDVLAQLKQGNKPAAPPTVYRSLDFLLEHGFIHRLASINAYIPCCHPREPHEAAFLICQSCSSVQEFSKNPLFSELNELVEKDGFDIKHTTVEISGLCKACRMDID